MKIKIQILVSLLLIGSFMLVSATIPDSQFWGCVSIDEYHAPSDAVVTAWVNGVNLANDSDGLVSGGDSCYLYSLSMKVDDPQDAGDYGATNGHTVSFKVNGFLANENGTVDSGSNSRLDLTVYSPNYEMAVCDLNNNGIIVKDYNDLMNAYKCFLGINKNCNKIKLQDWNLIKREYQCFVQQPIRWFDQNIFCYQNKKGLNIKLMIWNLKFKYLRKI